MNKKAKKTKRVAADDAKMLAHRILDAGLRRKVIDLYGHNQDWACGSDQYLALTKASKQEEAEALAHSFAVSEVRSFLLNKRLIQEDIALRTVDLALSEIG